MLDAPLRRLVGPPLDAAGRKLSAMGVRADALTAVGLAFGLGAAVAIGLAADLAALALLTAGRICDGLDGAVARAAGPSDRGGYLDIVCDFVFYGAVPLAFALRDPGGNAVCAAALLFAFYVNGASVLAFAAVAARRRVAEAVDGPKSILLTRGLVEGAETIAFFCAMIVWPAAFPPLALAFAGLTLMGAVARTTLAWHVFADDLPVEGDADRLPGRADADTRKG